MSIQIKDTTINIRLGKKDDMGAVMEMIQELADFEKMPLGPKITIADLQHDGFDSKPPAFHCLVAESTTVSSVEIVGYALYFPIYSTWQGRSMMLEDLYVRSSMRRQGIGHKLFNSVAKEAHKTGCSRLEFHVLKWNDARSFYEKKGAINLTEKEQWCYYRLTGDPLKQAASEAE